MINLFILVLSLISDVLSEAKDTCISYNGTVIQFGESYMRTVCESCECFGTDETGELIGPCFELGYSCPCDTLCCQAHCSDEVLNTNEAFKNTALNSHYSVIISVGVATLIIVLGLLFYLYRRRVTSYVRVTRRLYLDRQTSAPKPRSPELPPNYEDIALDGGPVRVQLPPRYDDLAPSYNFSVSYRHDQTESITAPTLSRDSSPPTVDT